MVQLKYTLISSHTHSSFDRMMLSQSSQRRNLWKPCVLYIFVIKWTPKINGGENKETHLVAARFELARALAHWESSNNLNPTP